MPGAGLQPHEHYPKTCQRLYEAGFDIDEVNVPWECEDFERLVHYTGNEISRRIGAGAVVLAHSYGANIALPEVVRHTNLGVLLASPSVACKEGLAYEMGASMIEKSFPGQAGIVREYSLTSLVGRLQVPAEGITVFVGEAEAKDYPFMAELAGIAARAAGIQPIYVPESPHFIEYSDEYVQQVADAAMRICQYPGS